VDTPEFRQRAGEMARAFKESCDEIRRLIGALKELTDRLHEAFHRADDPSYFTDFDLDFNFNGRQHRNDLDDIFTEYNRRAWRVLFEHLGIANVMSIKKRDEFRRQLDSGTLPPITEETIVATILGMGSEAQSFATEAAREVFDLLRPRSGWGGEYKTNSAFRVGRKVILTWMVTKGYGGDFRVTYQREPQITAIDGVFHLLDGKGVMRENRGPLFQAINASGREGRGERRPISVSRASRTATFTWSSSAWTWSSSSTAWRPASTCSAPILTDPPGGTDARPNAAGRSAARRKSGPRQSGETES
jgi:hypothetical protein